MIRKKLFYKLYSLIIILFSAACSIGGGMISPAATPTPTEEVSSAAEDPVTLDLHCPEEKTLFTLWFSHIGVLDIDAGGGETFYLKFENTPPSFFDFWIEADGTVSNEGIFREAPIGYLGTFIHPNDDDCPVQTFEGSWQMRATITGTCVNDTVNIHIIEEWVDPVLVSDCIGPVSSGPGLYSAPDLDLNFNLQDEYPSDSIEIPEGGPFHASYAYHLWLAGYELPIVPLVPEE
jgi:hypothetical protein